jgi:hypothetical protein
MDETITAPPANDGAAPLPAQPPEPGQSAAAQPQPQANVTESLEPSSDDNSSWLQSKGIDPDSPEAVAKLAEMYRNAEKQMTQATQRASELEKSMQTPQPQGGDIMQEFVQDYKRDKMVREFKDNTSDWKQYDSAMGKVLQEVVNTPYGQYTKSQLVNEGILSLNDVYLQAKGSSPVSNESIVNDAKQEVLQTLANTQRAGSATPNASNSSPQSQSKDPIVEAIMRARESN